MSIEALTKRLKQAYYTQDNDRATIEPRVKAIIESLKNDEKYKNCSDDELEELALYKLKTYVFASQANHFNIIVEATGKPTDPLWSQFTYEEILGMANDGVNVPKEFLDWANSMADADTTSYELADDSSEDSNTVVKLELETDDTTKLGQQRKLQKFASQAQKQEDLLTIKQEEIAEQTQNINAIQTDLESKQNLTLKKIDKITDEFNNLNKKVMNGEALNAEEIQRYKELGMLLNTQGQELIAQSKNVESDIKELMSQMNEVSSLININKEISSTIENLGTLYAGNEGRKNNVFIKGVTNNHTFAEVASFAYAAQSHNIALSAGTIGINLNFNSNELQFKVNSNAALAELVLNKADLLTPDPQKNETDESKINNDDDNKTELPFENKQPDAEIKDEPSAAENIVSKEEINEQPAAEPEIVQPQEGITEVSKSESTDNIEAPSGIDETEIIEENTQTESSDTIEESPLKTSATDYLNGCALKSSNMQTALDTVKNLRNEVRNINKSKISDMLKMVATFKNAFKQYSNLLEKVKKNKEFSNADQAEFLRLNAILDSDNGTIATDMQSKISLLDEFSSACDVIKTSSRENKEYGNAAIQSGIDYAREEIGNINKSSLMFLNKEQRYDILYGKSGDSISRDVIDSGEALVSQAKSAYTVIAFTGSLNSSAKEYSAQLSNLLTANSDKTTPLTQEFNSLLTSNQNKKNSSQETSEETATPKVQKEKATADDVSDVENTGKEADTQSQEAVKAGKNAIADKKQADEEIKKQQALMKLNANMIKTLTNDTNTANAQILELSGQAESEISELEVISGAETNQNNIQPGMTETRSLNSTVSTSQITSTNNTGVTDKLAGKIVTLDTIAKQSQQLGKRVTSNGRTINVLERNSIKADKKLSTAAKTKYQLAVQEQNAKEKEIKNNEKLTKTIADIGKVFTATKLAGMALMMTLWGAAAGSIMFTVGKYGEIATYATNAAINAAQGNLLGAAVNIGAAALSFMSTPPASSAATQGVKESAKTGTEAVANSTTNATVTEGASIIGQETGQELAQEVTQEVVQDTVQETVKDAGTDIIKDTSASAITDAGSEVIMDAGQAVTQDAVKGSLAQMPVQAPLLDVSVNLSKESAMAAANESIKNMSEQLAAETAKNLAKENTKILIKNALIEAGKAALLQVGEKSQQKDTKEDTKKKVLVQFERKKRDAIKRGIEKIKKSYRAR